MFKTRWCAGRGCDMRAVRERNHLDIWTHRRVWPEAENSFYLMGCDVTTDGSEPGVFIAARALLPRCQAGLRRLEFAEIFSRHSGYLRLITSSRISASGG